uniref:Uncharacterized protein n=1 Tax=Anguilla anguilla TaxID=7936 RepID=A0A0E9R236_ANGAN
MPVLKYHTSSNCQVAQNETQRGK